MEFAVSVLTRKVQTDRRLWIAFAVAFFVVGGFVMEVPIGKGSANLWYTAWGLASGGWHPIAIVYVFWSVVLAVPCIGLGWIAQAIYVWVRSAAKGVAVPPASSVTP